MSITRIGTTKRWSDAVIFNGAVYLVEIPVTLAADLTEQTYELLQLVEDGLVKYGSDKSRIVSVTIYLSDINQIAAFNAVWDHWLPAGSAPVRACVQAQLAHPEYKVELQLVAALISK